MPALHPRVHAAAQVTAQFELMDNPPAPRWLLTLLNGILIPAVILCFPLQANRPPRTPVPPRATLSLFTGTRARLAERSRLRVC